MTLCAMRRERRPTRAMLPADLDSHMVCQGHVQCDAAGTPAKFRHADYSFKSVRSSCSSRGSYPPIVGFLSRRLPASHFVRSLTWSISDVKHGSGCGGRDPLRPMPAHEDHQGQRRAPTNSSAPCWQLRYMSVSRHWRVEATRTCRADHCEEWETTSSSFCVGCGSYSTCQLRNVVAWRRRPVSPCRSLWSGGDRIGRPGHHHSDSDEGRHVGAKTDKGAASSNAFMWTASSGSRHAAR